MRRLLMATRRLLLQQPEHVAPKLYIVNDEGQVGSYCGNRLEFELEDAARAEMILFLLNRNAVQTWKLVQR